MDVSGVTVTQGIASRIPCGVRPPRKQILDRDPRGEAKRFTTQIHQAGSAAELLALLENVPDQAALDHIHISAAMMSLAKFNKYRRLRKSHVDSRAWSRLVSRLHELLQQNALSPWSSANVFYATGELYKILGTHLRHVLPRLCKAVRSEASKMNAQELSNCMLAAEKLQNVSPEVRNVVPTFVSCIPGKVADMTPQGLANCLLAIAKLVDASKVVLEAVPAIARRLQGNLFRMNSQDLANNFWAVAKLKDLSPEGLALAPMLVGRIVPQIGRFKTVELHMSVWAAQQLREHDLVAMVQAELDRRGR